MLISLILKLTNSTLPVSSVRASVAVLEDRSLRDCIVWHTSRQEEVSKKGVSVEVDVSGDVFNILDFRTHSGSTVITSVFFQ